MRLLATCVQAALPFSHPKRASIYINYARICNPLGSIWVQHLSIGMSLISSGRFETALLIPTPGFTDDFAVRLNRFGIQVKVDTELKLPERFFPDCWTLVNDTYQLVFKKAWEQFGYGKQHELWLRPTRPFTDKEIRAILDQAIKEGVAAREKHMELLREEAQRDGQQDEDSCGWAWLEIDPALLKRIHQLDIPNISTSYDTTAIVEDFKLHLKAVSDYQRMSASIRGIEAAATVLEKHGINSTMESMAD